MMRIKIHIFLFFTFGLFFNSKAQQKPGIGWFEDTQLYYNPAYAGSGEGVRATVLARNQWSALNSNNSRFPTSLCNVDLPIGKGIGGGIDFYRDRVGSVTDNNISVNGSYRLHLNATTFIQSGIKAGFSSVSINNSDAFQWDKGDPNKGDQSTGVSRIGIGILLKSPNYFLGLSSGDFKSFDNGLLSGGGVLKANYNLIAGGKVELSEYFTLIPSANIRFYDSQFNATFNLGLEANQTVIVGASYIHPSAVGLYGKVAMSSKMKFGYRHEFKFYEGFDNTLSSSEFLMTYGF